MTELELYKLINDNDIEYHWSGEEVYAFFYFFEIERLSKLLSNYSFDDGGVDCKLQQNYICVEMVDICEYYGIDPNNVFTKKD